MFANFVILRIALGSMSLGAADVAEQSPIGQVEIHPPFEGAYSCSEHWEGQLTFPGDALGADCYVTKLVDTPDGGAFSRAFKNDGLENTDWFGFGAQVLAPIDGTIAKVMVNPVSNRPGNLGEPPASFVVFAAKDGTNVLVAHIDAISVAEGDEIRAGQPFAKVGNNGYSRTPHVHIGAFRNGEPLQLRHDLRARGALNNDSD